MESRNPHQQPCGVAPQPGAQQPAPGAHVAPAPAAPEAPAHAAAGAPAAASPAHVAPQPGAPQPGAPAAASPAPGEPQKHHVHHSYIWLGSIRAALTILFVMVVASLSSIISLVAGAGEGALAEDAFAGVIALAATGAGVVVLVGVLAVYQLVSYKHLYFMLSADEFNLHSGVINKKRVHVPYQRVQSVDQRASLLQRLFGVCTVSIDTAGGASNKAVQVPYLTKQQAEWLRVELFSRKRAVLMGAQGAPAAAVGVAPAAAAAPAAPVPGAAPVPAPTPAPAPAHAAPASGNVLDAGAAVWQDVGGLFAGAELDTGRVTYEYGLTNKELLLTGLSNNTAFVLIIIGVLGIAGQLVDVLFSLFPRTSSSLVEGLAAQAAADVIGGAVAAGVAAFLVGIFVLWLLSGVGSCISYGGFRARRRDSRIEVERGLLQHVFQGVDIDRVQSVVVKQTFIRRLLGYCEVSLGKIDAAAEGEDSSQKSALNERGLVIHPFVKVSRVPEILAGIIPEYADLPTEAVPVAPVALRRALIRRCVLLGSGFWLAVCVAVLQLLLNVVAGPAGVASAFEMDLVGGQVVLGYLNAGAIAFYVLAVILLVLDAVGSVLWFRESSFAYNERFMQMSIGGFSRETMSFPRQKIQYGYTRSNPFQRRARTATLSVRTAAGVGGTTMRLIDVREQDAYTWLGWVKPRGNVLQ
ncbi:MULTISPECIES: PH domain-containing protein [unclassified Adlercreutzia]|uniref:PH domain-containing protein n=1 Tax=unclassified Adlercreutzia TaxID=2636013 RepID=UPI0013EC6E84|nr:MULTISPECIES: PH domain-containing protein [unclassified Adlercreutzia]